MIWILAFTDFSRFTFAVFARPTRLAIAPILRIFVNAVAMGPAGILNTESYPLFAKISTKARWAFAAEASVLVHANSVVFAGALSLAFVNVDFAPSSTKADLAFTDERIPCRATRGIV